MDKDFKKEFPHEVKVNVNGFSEYKGYSDLVTTYCASSKPCYYVVDQRQLELPTDDN
jgi:hypothetical protein